MEGFGKILVMAGAREAHALVAGLRARGRTVIATLSEPDRVLEPLPVPTRVGRFEGPADFDDWMRHHEVSCVIDASHAFEVQMSAQASRICTRRHLRYLRVLRPPWRSSGQDVWTFYRTLRAAADTVEPGMRVFANTGRASLPQFEGFTGEVLFLRQNHDQPDPPPMSFVRYVVGQPPYSQTDEETLFRRLRVSRLICRNVGGSASMAKLLAARRLGIRVAMVERPDPPLGAMVVDAVPEALAWEADA